jgi:predicted short-subunit dehydrogenase-like oxidoreductase (DUF2520 family)
MLPAMKRLSVAIIGAGRLGTALASRVAEAGYKVAIISREGRIPSVDRNADVTWFCVPDSQIARAAVSLSGHDWKGKTAFHSSGVLNSDELAPLRRKGASVASVHPLMTFVRGSIPQLKGVPFFVEGSQPALRVARNIVRKLGGTAVSLRKQDKAAYHAFATMICPLLVSLLAVSEEAALLARISRTQARRRTMPIVRQTLENYLKLGPANAFSGPIVRGDAATIRLHLRTLSRTPAARDAYIALARAALKYLPSRNKRELQEVLGEH